jgi:effector-binding domain-containing protein
VTYDVVVEAVAARPIAAARRRTTFAAIAGAIGTLLEGPWAFVRPVPGLRTDGHNVAIYWDTTGAGSIEVGIQVTRRFEDTANIVCSRTPGGTVARTVHYGPYDRLGAAHDAVMAWCKQHGYATTLPCWEVYGDWQDDPAQVRTDVFYLLA